MKDILGIDIGGSGIKGALVDVKKGVLTAGRYRIPTPQPSTPDAVSDAVAKIVTHFHWKGPVGCTFPAVIKRGIVYTAANVDKSWVGVNGSKLLKKRTDCPVLLVNDADGAGIAEMKYGAGRLYNRKGVIFVLTLGTGIGSAVFVDGALMPNTELGHIEMNGVEAEHYASDRIRKEEGLDWGEWAARVNEYLNLLESLFSPDLFILGGGVSKKHKKFLPLLNTHAQVVPAQLRNEAGIVGAAMAAKSLSA
ncbi:MAG: ROK family protein [Chloroflexota bacterium]|nr:ROK family protein [Chloroflexota bacterium]